MPSGFVNRIKGRQAVDGDYTVAKFGGSRVYTTFIDASVQSTTISNSGHTVLKWSGAASKIILDAPVMGIEKIITVSTMSSAHGCVATNSTGVTFFDGLNSFWNPSTVAGQAVTVSLIGISTSQWNNLGVNPNVTSTGGIITNGGMSNSS